MDKEEQERRAKTTSFNMRNNRGKRIIAVFLLITVLVISGLTVGYVIVSKTLNTAGDIYIDAIKDKSYGAISSQIGQCNFAAGKNVTEITKQLKENIINSYDDLDDLEKELKNENYDHITKIITDSLENSNQYLNGIRNADNGIIVATNSNILYNSDLELSDEDDGKGNFQTWNSFIDKNYNKQLARNTITDILNTKDSRYLIIEPKNNIMESDARKSHAIMPVMNNLGQLQVIYNKEGADGLKNYNLLSVDYIERNGDIFGNPQVYHGIRQTADYKIIVIQRCNIYEQLYNKNPELFDNHEVHESMIKKDNVLNMISILGIMQVLAFIEMLVVISLAFNSYILNTTQRKSSDRNRRSSDNVEKENKT